MNAEKDNPTGEMTLDELARIVQGGFLSVESRLDKVEVEIKEIKVDLVEVKSDIAEVKKDTEEIRAELNKKVDIFTHNDLKYRVEKLEDKFA